MKKWAPILESMGMTGSQLDNLSQLDENQSNQILEETKSEDFPSLFPIAMKIAAQTISQDLVRCSSYYYNFYTKRSNKLSTNLVMKTC